ncbi:MULTISPECIES: GNAT family N-acetyltransferase [unclassified Azospirillum]|uniref:GNAT family N-acetyltransferase n=1 Tax=unclassified Azospirillum TaxID=2630922 RepID=UPI000B685805|nr:MULTISPECIES: GNAT family N-acetyltransferase [unclassified Azospirillum]SNR97120.1 L-amino acid N-acyltransferase YncA [Azospirillum sp. RU38E]SNS14216.1 L-amino acid N-acyltransferase YncA [Azospirillum sp. RU37A]
MTTSPADHIRLATKSDIPNLMQIRLSVRENILSNPAKVPESAYDPFIEQGSLWLCEQVTGKCLGFAAADLRDGSIWALFISPEAEGRGIGQSLMAQMIGDLRRAGWQQATLSTQPESRAAAFYQRNGWVAGGMTGGGEQIFIRPL